MNIQHFQEINWIDPKAVVSVFEDADFVCLLHSTMPDGADIKLQRLGRYSFLSANPFMKITADDGKTFIDGKAVDGNPFDVIKEQLSLYTINHDTDLPPMQGGAMGWFGYDLGLYLEDIPTCKNPVRPYGDMAVGFYDWVISFDHEQQKTFVIANGITQDSKTVVANIVKKITGALQQPLKKPKSEKGVQTFFTRPEYESTVQKVIDYIYAGDIFQANMTQPFQVAFTEATPLQIYLYLSHINPAPFSGYMDCGNVQIASSSPERFLTANQNGLAESRPIKGTRPRGTTPEEDTNLSTDLLGSEKDRAENLMIVDLLRNDMSKVCGAGTINVPTVCDLESYQSVHHLVSVVRGILADGNTSVDLLKACYPGGSITGAPKIRSQEVIAELEVMQRGVYCGALGYIGFSGTMDTNITIRTMAIIEGVATFNAGGGIVSDSNPAEEYEETLDKARKMFEVFGCDTSDR